MILFGKYRPQRACLVHSTHPTWRADRDNPATATRVNERKVR
jgi:hypothetical protein